MCDVYLTGPKIETCFSGEAVWPVPHAVESRTFDVHIGRLRKAFAGLRNLRIRTVYGAGYALDTTINLRMF
ncbi:helix-turn-helix domain-containing protein [Rhizobium leguminosarum]|uniref:helix-turn-helix domain-containing protein n=1 Tax=Rhizobium leguminosarum TaxID=384 RepID=UPI003A94FB28